MRSLKNFSTLPSRTLSFSPEVGASRLADASKATVTLEPSPSVFSLLVSLGWTWSPRANAVSEPTAAVPFIFGVVVDATAPSGTSLAVMNLLSFSSCESLVGTGIHFSPVHRYSVRSMLLK